MTARPTPEQLEAAREALEVASTARPDRLVSRLDLTDALRHALAEVDALRSDIAGLHASHDAVRAALVERTAERDEARANALRNAEAVVNATARAPADLAELEAAWERATAHGDLYGTVAAITFIQVFRKHGGALLAEVRRLRRVEAAAKVLLDANECGLPLDGPWAALLAVTEKKA